MSLGARKGYSKCHRKEMCEIHSHSRCHFGLISVSADFSPLKDEAGDSVMWLAFGDVLFGRS